MLDRIESRVIACITACALVMSLCAVPAFAADSSDNSDGSVAVQSSDEATSLASSDVKVDYTAKVAGGQNPLKSVVYNGVTLKEGTDYTITCYGRDMYGDYTAPVKLWPTDVAKYMVVLEGTSRYYYDTGYYGFRSFMYQVESGTVAPTPAAKPTTTPAATTTTTTTKTSTSVTAGSTVSKSGTDYTVTSSGKSATVSIKKISKSKTSVKVPATITVNGKKYAVAGIAKGTFKGTKVKTVTVKSKKLTKKSVKGCFKGSKVTKVKVPKSKLKAYKKIFTKANCGRAVKVIGV